MKKNNINMALVVLTIFTSLIATRAHASVAADQLKSELAQVGIAQFTDHDYKPGTIKHIVLFRYLDTVTQEQKDEVKRRFLALQKLATREGKPYIVSIATGLQNSGEGVDQDLEQGFIVTLRSEGDRNFYVGQPLINDSHFYDAAHQDFKNFVGPLLHQDPLGVLVFDFKIEGLAK